MYLKVGSRGKEVKLLQEELTRRGYFNGPCSSYFGSLTKAAVEKYQAENNLLVDGIVGEKTWRSLFEKNEENQKPFDFSNPEDIQKLLPNARIENIKKYLPDIISALEKYDLFYPEMFIMAIATIGVETSSFKPISEMISKYNTAPGKRPFGLYDFRTELGNFSVGDGEKYRGRGFIQLTGKYNYKEIGDILGIDLLDNPELANDGKIAAEILALFIKKREDRILTAIQNNDLATARKIINGGCHGLQEFINVFLRAKKYIRELNYEA